MGDCFTSFSDGPISFPFVYISRITCVSFDTSDSSWSRLPIQLPTYDFAFDDSTTLDTIPLCAVWFRFSSTFLDTIRTLRHEMNPKTRLPSLAPNECRSNFRVECVLTMHLVLVNYWYFMTLLTLYCPADRTFSSFINTYHSLIHPEIFLNSRKSLEISLE